ncbi:uncharacterized protein LOC131217404 [Magnolia sinica]|uniref:uncharacterized protein LOC131217404 n=1 Tax=Magnolia sinica TaxID=86752 RepID=UPI0026599C7B|nr:uncharacterized protein LOC131217404 [Magnolia sinica]
MLTIEVSLSQPPEKMFITFVYTKCSQILRKKLWEDLSLFSVGCHSPWAVGGDFNAITSQSERLGLPLFDARSVADFVDLLASVGLSDALFSGNRFTLGSSQSSHPRVWARLDRVCCNSQWLQSFPSFHVNHLPRHNSDHVPLLLIFPEPHPQGPKAFRFQRMWCSHSGFHNLIQDVWFTAAIGNLIQIFIAKFKAVKLALKHWNKVTFGNIFSQIQSTVSDLSRAEVVAFDAPSPEAQ